jgi:hypothetical protein
MTTLLILWSAVTVVMIGWLVFGGRGREVNPTHLCYLRCSGLRRISCLFGYEVATAICARIDRYLVMREGR